MICPEENRLDAKGVLKHPFITNNMNREPNTNLSEDMKSKIVNLKQYTESTLLQRIVFTAMSQRLSFKEIETLQDIFISMDVDNDGVISNEEFLNGLRNLEISENDEEIKKIFQKMDTDKSKKINYSEFITAAIDKKFLINKEKLKEIFDNFDQDKDGKISFDEFKKALKTDGIDNRAFDDLKDEFEICDSNNDGFIEYEEFMIHISSSKERIKNKRSTGGW